MLGERESCGGEAAVDEVGAELNMAQASTEGALKVVVVGEGNIGQRAAP